MNTKFLMGSIFCVVFSTLNCMEVNSRVEKGTSFSFAIHYTSSDNTLNLSNQGITGPSLDAMIFDLLTFININKVEILNLEENKFESVDLTLLKKMANLLTNSTLKTISLKNNFHNADTVKEESLMLSSVAISQLVSSIGQLQDLFKESLAEANQQTTTYVTKQILLDDMPPLSIISEIKLPPTECQKIKTFAVSFGKGLVLLILSSGATILTFYLSGHLMGCSASN